MKLNITEKNLNINDELVSDNKTYLVFFTNDKIYNKYVNCLLYMNVTTANLTDYKFIVVVQKQ